MNYSTFKFFTDASILRQVGRSLLIALFERFIPLLPSKYFLPSPRPDNEEYFDCLALVLERTCELPAELIQALVEIESLAAPENRKRIEAALGTDPQDAEASALPLAIRFWLRSHPGDAPSTEAPSAVVRPTEGLSTDVRSTEAVISSGVTPNAEPVSPSVPDPDQQAFQGLAQLSPAQYDRARRAEAGRLHLRLKTLDAEVAKIRTELGIEAQANAVKLPAIEPWPEPVDGAELLDQVSCRYTAYMVLPLGAADAFALWGVHPHALAAFHLSPRLNLLSPRGGCGKTTALDVLATMVPRPLRTENISAPVLFRLVDRYQPVLLLDEVDAYLSHAEELRGLLNAGHKRGACALRCEGDGKDVRVFNAFAPAVLAGIGSLPATLRDRSILIPLVEAEEGQISTRFDPLHIEIEIVLARKLARWAKDNFPALVACNPTLPPGAFNRLADNWRPLFAIAQVAGGDWPERALAAFTHLKHQKSPRTGKFNGVVTPEAIAVLSAVRCAFRQSGATRMYSKQLVASLRGLSKTEPDILSGDGKVGDSTLLGTEESCLARQLERFGVTPHKIRIGKGQGRGYELEDFSEAFGCFLDGGFAC
jgi:putative DNA primase/helicase